MPDADWRGGEQPFLDLRDAVTLDGYVDHTKLGPPVPAVFRHFIELVRGLTGLIYGRRTFRTPRWAATTHSISCVLYIRAGWKPQPANLSVAATRARLLGGSRAL
jgi:hypothetical protein